MLNYRECFCFYYFYFNRKIIDNINNISVPSRYEYFLNNLLIYFPMVNPKKVKEKLVIVKIVDDKSKLLVIALNPIPIEKLSSDTPIAKRSVPNLFNFISLFEGLINSMNIWSDININIIPNMISVLIGIILVILYDIRFPNKGIIKWNIPTVNEIFNIFFIFKLYIPITVATENASIDKQTPIINNTISSCILSPY